MCNSKILAILLYSYVMKNKKAMQLKKCNLYSVDLAERSYLTNSEDYKINQTDPQQNKSNFWFFDKRRRLQYPGKNPQSKVGNHQT